MRIDNFHGERLHTTPSRSDRNITSWTCQVRTSWLIWLLATNLRRSRSPTNLKLSTQWIIIHWVWRLNCPSWKETLTQTSLWFVTVCLYFSGGICGKKKAVGRGSVGLVFVAMNSPGEKVCDKEATEWRRWGGSVYLSKKKKILHGIKSEHIVKFKIACMEPCAIRFEYLFFDFASFWRLNYCWQSGQTSWTSSHEWGNRPIFTSKKDRPGNGSQACTLV